MMSFLMPKIPAPIAPPPPPAPPMMASASIQGDAAAARAAAATSGGQGFAGTVQSSPQGAASPPTALKALLGS
jgi:hypothetical protein